MRRIAEHWQRIASREKRLSSRVLSRAKKPRIHAHWAVFLDSGRAAARRPGMTVQGLTPERLYSTNPRIPDAVHVPRSAARRWRAGGAQRNPPSGFERMAGCVPLHPPVATPIAGAGMAPISVVAAGISECRV